MVTPFWEGMVATALCLSAAPSPPPLYNPINDPLIDPIVDPSIVSNNPDDPTDIQQNTVGDPPLHTLPPGITSLPDTAPDLTEQESETEDASNLPYSAPFIA